MNQKHLKRNKLLKQVCSRFDTFTHETIKIIAIACHTTYPTVVKYLLDNGCSLLRTS